MRANDNAARRSMLVALLLASRLLALGADRVVVVCNCSVGAYREALEGVTQTLGREPRVVPTDASGAAALGQLARQEPGRLYIAIGQDALHLAIGARLEA